MTMPISMRRLVAAALALNALSAHALAEPVPGGQVVVSGAIPDEASRAAILARLRELYGTSAVVDRMEVSNVVAPPNWGSYMSKLLQPDLKQVHQGELQVSGTQVTLKGRVANDGLRQQVAANAATALNPTYTVTNALVASAGGQSLLDKTLSNRVVEFELSAATLTPLGAAILDEMLEAIRQLNNPKLQIIGHTDSTGDRGANIALSLARATTVRNYLIAKGVPAGSLTAVGAGPDRPANANDTVEGRAKNRRIEFSLMN